MGCSLCQLSFDNLPPSPRAPHPFPSALFQRGSCDSETHSLSLPQSSPEKRSCTLPRSCSLKKQRTFRPRRTARICRKNKTPQTFPFRLPTLSSCRTFYSPTARQGRTCRFPPETAVRCFLYPPDFPLKLPPGLISAAGPPPLVA